jgi:hypothetical protein
VNSTDTSGLEKAASVAKNATAVVLIVGLDQSCESEGLDRYALELPGQQTALIESVLSARANATLPVVLVVMSGGAVCLGEYADDPRVGAILFVGYPGQSGGQALAETLYGISNPSGRLTQSFYRGDYVDTTPYTNMAFRPNAKRGYPGRTYRFYTDQDKIVYPFGTGLGYAPFQYDSVTTDRRINETVIDLSVRVCNLGDMAGSEVVLAFLVPPNAGVGGNPLQILRGFEKVAVAPTECAVVQFTLGEDDVSLPDAQGVVSVVPGEWEVVFGQGAATASSKFEVL